MVTVGAGAILGGTGSFGAGILANGILAPGNSIGTMAVTGPLTFGAGSTYRVEVNAAGQSERTEVTGPAKLDGTVKVIPEAGRYASRTALPILIGPSHIGPFDAVTSPTAPLLPTPSSHPVCPNQA